ncbi:MAG: homocysteine S-methyltransferase family protein [Phycisphaerae bacterium]|nr:homocysteine S-methyltransferase family protein [Phycisphaerae bacterium]
MAKLKLSERIKAGTFFLDGAMGTQLIDSGIEMGRCGDYLSVTNPDAVKAVHTAYLKAGSDAISTNTFGANTITLAKHGMEGELENICVSGAKNAIDAVEAVCGKDADKYVLGDIGPSGDFFEPVGLLKAEDLRTAIAAQAAALDKGGVDGFIIETMTDLEEAAAAVEAVKSVSQLPVFISFAFDPAGGRFRTMMGVSAEMIVERLTPLGVDAIGFNCGSLGMDEYVKLAEIFADLLKDTNTLLMAEANAGKPELVEGGVNFSLTPEDFAVAGEKILAAGASIIGGCCGTTPAHIAALAGKSGNP